MIFNEKKIQVFFLIVFSFVVTILLLEIFLRISGLVILRTQVRNIPINTTRDFNIICVGDSFTFGLGGDKGYDYPSQLGEILKEQQAAKNIKVINKGYPGGNSSMILEKVDALLKNYNPKILIVLIGANDTVNMENINLGCIKNAPLNITLDSKFSSLRAYKLFKYITLSILSSFKQREQECACVRVGQKDGGIESHKISEATLMDIRNNALTFINNRQFAKAVPLLEQLVVSDISDPDIYYSLGYAYRDSGDINKAEWILKEGIKKFPREDKLYEKLGNCLVSRLEFKEAIIVFKKAVELNHCNTLALAGLFHAYLNRNEYDGRIEKLLTRNTKYALILRLMRNRGSGNNINNANRDKLIKQIFLCNMEKIISKAKDCGINMIVTTYPKGFGFSEELRELCFKTRTRFIDMQEAFNLKLKNRDAKDYFIPDGHCNANGYRIMAEIIAAEVNNLLKNKKYENCTGSMPSLGNV